MVWPERSHHIGPVPGGLMGDDYPLEYYEDGYPEAAPMPRPETQTGDGEGCLVQEDRFGTRCVLSDTLSLRVATAVALMTVLTLAQSDCGKPPQPF